MKPTFIREALLSDLPDIVECGKRFFEYADFKRYGWYMDEGSFTYLMTQYVERDDCVVLCLMNGLRVVGGIAASTAPFVYNMKYKLALELYYWVEPDYRGIKSIRMFDMYEERLKEMGVKWSMVTLPDTDMAGKIEEFYIRRGYVKNETRFIKTL